MTGPILGGIIGKYCFGQTENCGYQPFHGNGGFWSRTLALPFGLFALSLLA